MSVLSVANVQETLKNQPVAVVAGVVALASLYRLYGGEGRKGNGARAPPVVSYWVPWLGSAVTMGKDPDAFFRQAKEALGPMFTVNAVGQTVTYITDPALISAVYRDAKLFEFTPIRMDISEKIFSLTPEATHSAWMAGDYFDMHHRALSPAQIGPLLQAYSGHAQRCLFNTLEQLLVPQAGESAKSVALADLVVAPAYHAASYTFFGSSFDSERLIDDFRTFDGAFHMMLARTPRVLIPAPYKAWDRILHAFEEYLEKPHEDACQLMLDSEAGAKAQGWSSWNIAAMLASDLWALQANAVWAAYWVLAFCLPQPNGQGLKPLLVELQQARQQWDAHHPDTPFPTSLSPSADGKTAETVTAFIKETELPLLSSTIHEALRLATSTFSIRRVTHDTVFPSAPTASMPEGGYVLKEGDRVVCATRSVHFDESVFEDASAFRMDRFLGSKGTAGRTMPFGGGISMCEGRHFAQGEIKTYLALLLSSVEFELDPARPERPELFKERIGVGIMPPKGDLYVKIRRTTAKV